MEREDIVGTKISDVMTARPLAVESQTSVREAARLMESEDVGSLPVVEEGGRLVGVVTDRDVAIRVVAAGRDPESTSVGDIASRDLVTLTPEDDLDDALALMAREQVRRLPIVVRDDELVGVVSQADVAHSAKEKHVGEVVEAISRPSHGPRISGGRVEDDSSREADEQSPRREEQSYRDEQSRAEQPQSAEQSQRAEQPRREEAEPPVERR